MDPEQKKRVMVLGALVIALPLILWFVLRKSPEEQAAQAQIDQAQAQNQTGTSAVTPIQSVFDENSVDINALFANIREVSFRYEDVRTQRDPMLPVSGDVVDVYGPGGTGNTQGEEQVLYVAQRLQVTGILWDESSPLAVINDGNVDNIVEVGFTYEEHGDRLRVKAIGRDYVIVEVTLSDGELIEITKELKEQ